MKGHKVDVDDYPISAYAPSAVFEPADACLIPALGRPHQIRLEVKIILASDQNNRMFLLIL